MKNNIRGILIGIAVTVLIFAIYLNWNSVSNIFQSKASKNVEEGSIITINFLESTKKYEVLKIPTTKSTPKSLQSEYIKEL